jgi:FkbM family methyltransferase
MSDPRPEAGGSRPPPGRLPLAELAWRASRGLSRAERRALALRLLEDEAEEITFRRDGTRWTAFPWDHMISGLLFVTGGFQVREVEAVLAWMACHGRFAPPGDVIVDVGANIGTSTIPFAQARPGCRVVAIEPVPDVFAVLRRNVADNGLTGRVTCVEAAISADGRDRAEMILPAGNGGGGEIRRPDRQPSFAGRHAVRGVVDVRAAGLADLLRAHGVAPERVAFVWSDSQGSETDVIASGSSLWAAGVPLFTELDPSTWGGRDGVEAFLAVAFRHFAAFIDAETLILDAAVPSRPIAELASFCHTLGADGGDALLLPDGAPLRPEAGPAGPA